VQRLQCRLGIQSEFLAKQAAGLLVEVERLGLPPGAVHGQHELAAEALPEGMGGHQGLEFADRLAVTAQGQVRLDAGFERDQSQLFQACDLLLGQGLVGEVLQGRAAP
jgi:hypothetical protein